MGFASELLTPETTGEQGRGDGLFTDQHRWATNAALHHGALSGEKEFRMSRVFVPDRQLLFLPLRRCSYCGATTSGATGCGATGCGATGVPLHVEHIVPRTQGR